MAAKTSRQIAYALIEAFLREYRKKFAAAPSGMNRHALSYGFESLYKDYGEMAEEIIKYYVKNYHDPDPFSFIYKYGDVAEAMEQERRDVEDRERLYRNTVKRVIERRNKIGTHEGTEGTISSTE